MPEPKLTSQETLADRLAWVLRVWFTGSQTAMARALGVSQASVSRAVRGRNQPSGKLLTAAAALPGLSEEWLLTGRGAPQTVAVQDAGPRPHVTASLPVSAGILPGPPANCTLRLQGESFPVPEVHYTPTRYWLRVTDALKMAGGLSTRLIAGDLALMETDRRAWETDVSVLENKLCSLRLTCEQDAVLLLARYGSEFALGNEHFVFRCQPPQHEARISFGGAETRFCNLPWDSDEEEKEPAISEDHQMQSRPAGGSTRHVALHEIVGCYVYHVSLTA